MPSDCLPRERLLAIGEKALSNQELLAILLRTGSKEADVMTVAATLLKQFKQLFLFAASHIERVNGY